MSAGSSGYNNWGWKNTGSTNSATGDYGYEYIYDENPIYSTDTGLSALQKQIEEISKEKAQIMDKEIKEEVKKFLTDKLKSEIQKQAQHLTKDIENLKGEKNKLKKSIFALQKSLQKTRKEIKEETEEIEKLLKEYKDSIIRYQILDL